MEQIGRYRILSEIGRGAMGIVYQAQDPAIGRTVAIKTIRLSDFEDDSERAKLQDRLFREAQSAGMLSHPGIVTIYDVAAEGDLAYIAMEFVDGPTLERMLVSDPPEGAVILSILSQTAAALDYAHKRGIVHRDIKPANIMIHERTTAKIADFGVAKIQSHQMTHAGLMVGTPNYMSPEQIRGHAVSGRSDQFSLGVIAYELLTGDKPFAAESMPALVFKIVQEEPASVQRLNNTLSWAVDTVIKRALSKNAADRYPTCSDFVFALENACRASKNWQPIAPTVMPDLPTVTATVERSPSPVDQKRREEVLPRPHQGVAPVLPPVAAPVSEPVPRLLRTMRAVALIVFAGGVISALLVWALDRFSSTETPAKVQDTTASTAESRPDPTAPQPPASQPDGTVAPSEPMVEPAAPPAAPSKSIPTDTADVATQFETNPPGAFMVIDGASALSCVSPCALILKRGRHSLAATKEGYHRTLRILEIPADNQVFLNLARVTGTLMLRSEPLGAAIYVDGQLRTEKTPAVLALPIGDHTIEVDRNGSRESRQVTVKESVIINLSFDLTER